MSVEYVRQIDPTGFGTSGVRYRYAYDEDGERLYGEVAAWQQGTVVVGVQVESFSPDACVCTYAEMQYKKVAANIR